MKIGALAVSGTKARLAGYDNFVILNHHEEPHGFFCSSGFSAVYIRALLPVC